MDIGREGKRFRTEPLEDPFEPEAPVEEPVTLPDPAETEPVKQT